MASILNQALVVILLAGAVTSSPLSTHIGTRQANHAAHLRSGRHSFTQVRNPHYHFNGAWSVKKTYLKFGRPVPDWLEVAVASAPAEFAGLLSRDNGSASATPINSFDDAYVTPVSIGTPPQTLHLDIDTGSSDLWVFSSETPSSQVNGQTEYDPSKSSTAEKLTGEEWAISYGDGSSSSGDVYTDVVAVGGVNVTGQAVELAKTVSSSFTSEPSIDGLLGLAFSSLNTVSPTPQKTFFDTAKPALDAPLFTVDLKHQAPGTYTFGFIDAGRHTGTIAYTAADPRRGFWAFTAPGYAIGDDGAFRAEAFDAIADTGTTLLYLPAAVARAYYAHVPGAARSAAAGGWVFPCAAAPPPPFTFGVGVGDAAAAAAAARITVPGEYLDYGPVATGSASCFGGIQSSAGIGINIFGDVALKAAYVVFDDGASGPRLGWASK